jgi:formylglycine-generating enzyme required for sulfatase activity
MAPIAAFAHALRSFRAGELTIEELLSEVDRQLVMEKVSSGTLLECVELQQSIEPLPSDAYGSILNRIASWPQDPTVVTSAPRERENHRSTSVAVGRVLQGRFRLIALIGEGGMSRVYKAIDMRRVEAGVDDPYIAVKILTSPFSQYFGSLTVMQREAHKLQNLTHPNIVRVIDFDRDGQTVFMTMEYLAGESLFMKLRSPGPGMARDEAQSIVIAVARALEYAHGNHIVHGDLKPGNVIVTAQGVVKVIDFGMARFIAPPGAVRDNKEPGRGKQIAAVTPRYASPEMLAGQDPGPADDVYALACLAYEVLSGEHPFERKGDPAERDPRWRPPRPTGMEASQYAALLRALTFDRDKRTPTARRFLEEFLPRRRNTTVKRMVWIGCAAIAIGLAVFYRFSLQHRDSRSTMPAIAPAPGTVIRDCPMCPLMTVLPVGSFEQGTANGDTESQAFEQPQHLVAINYPLAMSSNEITVAEFREFAEATGRNMSGCNIYEGRWEYRSDASWRDPGFEQSAAHPVTCVSWNDATAYAAWLSVKRGHTYRLASASEWEYAARAGSESAQPWNSTGEGACAVANVADQSAARRFPGWEIFACNDRFVNTAPVGSFKPNAFGLNDMLGNVFEWVQDCWHDDYRGAPADGSARMDGDCKEHELRGGSWFSSPRYVRASYRNRFETDYRSSSVGFRLVREFGR